jgi:ureidoglycolate dehydrogenase (NAD+)
MATSIVPWNLVANAATEGISIPTGWGVNKDGMDTTDPREVNALHPFGGHKGSGLGIMIDVLCAMLIGAPFGPDIPKMYGDMTEARRLGGLVGAISISHFVDRGLFAQRVTEMIAQLAAIPPAAGFERVKFPGEPELEMKRRREREGIPIGLRTLAELNELAAAHNLPSLTGATAGQPLHV